jgi:hypothetical protein
LIAGAVLKNNTGAPSHDIHLVRFAYRHSYLKLFINTNNGPKPKCKVCDVPYINFDLCLKHILESHSDILEGLYPAFIGNQFNSKNKIQYLNPQIMKAKAIATISLPFEHLDHFI